MFWGLIQVQHGTDKDLFKSELYSIFIRSHQIDESNFS